MSKKVLVLRYCSLQYGDIAETSFPLSSSGDLTFSKIHKAKTVTNIVKKIVRIIFFISFSPLKIFEAFYIPYNEPLISSNFPLCLSIPI